MYSLLIKNAELIDGTGSPSQKCDIAIEGDRIVSIAPHITSAAHEIVDAKGRLVTPGFIDIQNHSDTHWQLFDNPKLESLITQGFTTIIVGNSGASLAPLISRDALLSLQKWHTLEGANINWQSFAEFVESMNTSTYGCNVGSLVGYSTLRRGLIGDRISALSDEELHTIAKLADDAMQQGAFGVSTGFSYAHEVTISDIELAELAKITKKHNALLSVHLRNEADHIIESVREAITIAKQEGANLKIAHLKVRYPENWPLLNEVITELETAWHQGLNVHFDVYPYTSTWQPLYTYLPTWAVQGSRLHLLELLKNPPQRAKILTALQNSSAHLATLTVASTSTKLSVIGKSLSQIASGMETSSEEAMLHLIENGGPEILVFDTSLDATSVETLCNHPLGFIATNGGGYNINDTSKLVHPRCFGSAPKFLRTAIDKKAISLPEAIRKLTGAPAQKLGILDRGVLKVDAKADVLIIDPTKINGKATENNPYQYSEGIDYSWVNGQGVITKGLVTGTRAGTYLKKG